MIGDELLITDYHRAAARKLFDYLISREHEGTTAVSISGESGCGKSETASCLMELLEAEGRCCVLLAQDDYFRFPPKSNHRKRLDDISWVGQGEVNMDLLDEHVAALKEGCPKGLSKPLVYFEEDRISEEVIGPGPFDIVIVEGTYTATLSNVDVRAFIDRNYRQTKKARLKRAREPTLKFLEKVLEIEHKIISRQKDLADVVIGPPPEEVEN